MPNDSQGGKSDKMEWDPIPQMIIYLLILLVPLIMVKFGNKKDILAGFSLSIFIFFIWIFSYIFSSDAGIYLWSKYIVIISSFICMSYCGLYFYNAWFKKSKGGQFT